MDVKTIVSIFLGSILIQASIFGVVGNKISERDEEVPKLGEEVPKLGEEVPKLGKDETAAIRALSLNNVILRKRLIEEEVEQNRKKRVRKAQTRQEEKGCKEFKTRIEAIATKQSQECVCSITSDGVFYYVCDCRYCATEYCGC